MAIAYVTSGDSYPGVDGTSLTFNFNTTSPTDGVMVISSTSSGGDFQTDMTWNGVSVFGTQVKVALSGTRYLYMYVVALGNTGGTHDIVATWSSSSDREIHAAVYSGVNQTGLPENSQTSTGAGDRTVTYTNASTSWGVTVAKGSAVPPGNSTNVTTAGRTAATAYAFGDSNGAPGTNFSQTWTFSSGDGAMIGMTLPVKSASASANGNFLELL